MLNPYDLIEATVEKVITESSSIKTFVINPKEKIRFTTGQFIEFAIPGVGEAPFTPSSSPFETERIEVTIMKAGRLTEAIHGLKKGDTVGIRGPYGKPYPVDKFYDKEILILGGGVGMAPLRSFLLTLLAQKDRFKRIVLCYGAKTPEDIIYKDQFERWMQENGLEVHRSVDKADGTWKEAEGVVTVLLDKFKIDLKNSVAVVCGPPIMMKFGTFKLLEKGFEPKQIYLSMEKNMSCGVGKCGHCGLGKLYVCKDGPVLSYDKIKNMAEIWD